MYRFICLLFFFIGIFFLLPCLPVQAEQLFSATKSSPDEGIGRYSQFVLNAMLQDIGLALDDSKKVSPDAKKGTDKQKKSPKKKSTEKKKASVKKKTDDADGWADDDDFFEDDSDFDSMGFDDVVAGFDKEFEDTVAAWDKEYEETVARWNKAKKAYNKEKKKYAATTYNMKAFAPSDTVLSSVAVTPVKVEMNTFKVGAYHVIPYALDLDIRNQNFRLTCAAFAGIRTIEILLNRYRDISGYQQIRNIDLSEQHFYWISRSDCINTPCTDGGSDFDYGFINSNKQSPETAIRLEMNCPYVPYANTSNVTYTPLATCTAKKGAFRVTKFHRGLQLNQLVNELAANRPVAAGLKLPKSFYSAKGFIKLNDPESQEKGIDSHAGGHAVTFVGFIKLPERYWEDEGKYCVITTNSWGVGWGVGGHSCISQKWLEKYAIKGLMTSVEEVSTIR